MPAATDMVVLDPAVESVSPDRKERGIADSTELSANCTPASEIAVVMLCDPYDGE